MFRSAGLRFFFVGALALLMFIPLSMVSGVVDDRARYARQATAEVSSEWGGVQLISGPLLIVPVTEEVTYERKREAIDPTSGQTLRDDKGLIIYERFEETRIEERAPVYLYPDTFNADLSTRTDTRKRGIFEVPVYRAEADISFNFETATAETVLVGDEVLNWDAAVLQVYLSDNRGLRGDTVLTNDGVPLLLEPIAGGNDRTGVEAMLGDPRTSGQFRLSMTLNGAQSLSAVAVGRSSRLTLASDWPDPSFFGDFLPDTSEVREDGFDAVWTVPHLARPLPQVSREFPDRFARGQATMGARFITPNDFYQKAYRSARYGILFIALTFLTILLLDRTNARPTHPVQYLLVGLAQCVFVLLMVSYAEQIGFGLAYLLASGATIALLVMFGATALKLGRRTLVLGALLIVVYAVLYLILRSADYALLAGSTLAFAALAGTMILTRNEDWHGPERTGGLMSRLRGTPKRDPSPAA